MTEATVFVQSLIKTNMVCPFQFDMVIAMGEPTKAPVKEEDDNDDDDDDDDDDEEKESEDLETFYDKIGDIESKLKTNKLNNAKAPCKIAEAVQSRRIFGDLYAQFLDQNKLQNVDDKVSYLRNKRI